MICRAVELNFTLYLYIPIIPLSKTSIRKEKCMIVDKLITPVGPFRVFKNSDTCFFSVEESDYNTFWLNDNSAVYPEGCYKITIDLISFSVGDKITCELSNGEMVNDGGGELTLNIVGELGNYVIGIGASDTETYECYHSLQDQWPLDMNITKYALPYETSEVTKRGYVFTIKDNPAEYRDRYYRKYIELSLVWENQEKDYAWEIVSFLTS